MEQVSKRYDISLEDGAARADEAERKFKLSPWNSPSLLRTTPIFIGLATGGNLQPNEHEEPNFIAYYCIRAQRA